MESRIKATNLAEVRDVRCRILPTRRPELFQALGDKAQGAALMDLAELGLEMQKLGVLLYRGGGEKHPFIYLNGAMVSLDAMIQGYVVALQNGVPAGLTAVATPKATVVGVQEGAIAAMSEDATAGEKKRPGLNAVPLHESPAKSSPGNTGSRDSSAGAVDAQPRREQVRPVEDRGERSPGNWPPTPVAQAIEDARPAASSGAKSAAVAALWEDAMLK